MKRLTILTLFMIVFASAAIAATSSDLTGTWDGNNLTSTSFQSYHFDLFEDGTGYYIDTLDADIMNSGKSPEIVWSINGELLIIQYLGKQAEFRIVNNNGFINLESSTGAILTSSNAKAKIIDEVQSENPEHI